MKRQSEKRIEKTTREAQPRPDACPPFKKKRFEVRDLGVRPGFTTTAGTEELNRDSTSNVGKEKRMTWGGKKRVLQLINKAYNAGGGTSTWNQNFRLRGKSNVTTQYHLQRCLKLKKDI